MTPGSKQLNVKSSLAEMKISETDDDDDDAPDFGETNPKKDNRVSAAFVTGNLLDEPEEMEHANNLSKHESLNLHDDE